MADLPSGFWSGWILVLTAFSLAGLAWLVLSVYLMPGAEPGPDGEPVWDTDLREGSNAPPLWWFWMLLGAMVFSLVYLILYPGLGSYPGLLNWSAGKRIIESTNNFKQRFNEQRDAIAASSLAEIQNDLDLMVIAERIFRRECAACHGPDGRGQAEMFPNLMDVDWQWGATAEQIEQTIRNGRQPMMPAWQAIIGADNVGQVADYVQQFNTAADTHAGKVVYDQYCMACHSADGSGNVLLGAPSLADSSWLYGSSIDSIVHSVANGRSGVMPAFATRLDDLQVKLLVALLAR